MDGIARYQGEEVAFLESSGYAPDETKVIADHMSLLTNGLFSLRRMKSWGSKQEDIRVALLQQVGKFLHFSEMALLGDFFVVIPVAMIPLDDNGTTKSFMGMLQVKVGTLEKTNWPIANDPLQMCIQDTMNIMDDHEVSQEDAEVSVIEMKKRSLPCG
jgi:hypothetical protein